MISLDKESVKGIAALLVHAAKIDENYSEDEKLLIKNFGIILSFARACKVLGAPNTPPKALERLAPHKPTSTRGLYFAIFIKTKESVINADASREK